VSDEFTIRDCRFHQPELHHSGDEGAWWQRLSQLDSIPQQFEKLKGTLTGGAVGAIEVGVDVLPRAEYICDISTPPRSAR
jgi:hypothetical protein